MPWSCSCYLMYIAATERAHAHSIVAISKIRCHGIAFKVYTHTRRQRSMLSLKITKMHFKLAVLRLLCMNDVPGIDNIAEIYHNFLSFLIYSAAFSRNWHRIVDCVVYTCRPISDSIYIIVKLHRLLQTRNNSSNVDYFLRTCGHVTGIQYSALFIILFYCRNTCAECFWLLCS